MQWLSCAEVTVGWSSLILFRFKQTEGVDSVQQCCQHVWNNEKLHFCLFCIGRAQSNWSSKFQNPPTVQYEDSSCTHSVLSVTLRLRPSQVSMININPDLATFTKLGGLTILHNSSDYEKQERDISRETKWQKHIYVIIVNTVDRQDTGS